MPEDLREKVEQSLKEIGEVEYRKRSHRSSGPTRARVLPPEDLVHEKTETIRKGSANRVHFACSNAKCKEPIRKDKWDTHVLQATSDLHPQEAPGDVLERSQNFAPKGEWDTKEARMQRVVTFMEQRHYLALARMHGEADLTKKVTDANRFFIRLTNMVRSMDPTTKILLKHYEEHYKSGNMGDLANLTLSVWKTYNTYVPVVFHRTRITLDSMA